MSTTLARQSNLVDGGRIRQILTNLLSNAIKFTKKGRIIVSVKWKKQKGKEAWVHITVEDTGIGIPEA